MSFAEFHLEIIGQAEPNKVGVLFYSPESHQRLRLRFSEALRSPDFGNAVNAFVRSVAAFQAAEQPRAAKELLALGAEVALEMKEENAAPAEKLKTAVTGAANLSKMRPVGAEPAPEGALKATAFIRPLPKRRG